MKRKEIDELHDKIVEELVKMTGDIRDDIIALKIDKTMGKLKNVNEIKNKKKDLARIYTILSEKRFANNESNVNEKGKEGVGADSK